MMKVLEILVFSAAAFVLCNANKPVVIMSKDTILSDLQAFETWTTINNRSYSNLVEGEKKMANFIKNFRTVHNHNQEKRASWEMALNKFSDMSFEEFSSLYLMAAQNCSATRKGHPLSGQVAPEHKDWRNEGNYVTPVKNQGTCGSCWTFSTTGCLESATAIHSTGHPLYSFSEQQLLDCAQAFDDHGCNGGLPSHAFEYIHYNKGLMTEASYPYKATGGPCKFVPSEAKGFVKEVVNITMGSETEIKDAVAFQNPVSVAFEVIKSFQHYKSGIFSSESCGTKPSQVNHAVLVVGYGVNADTGMKYWIIKNSWGPEWGIKGYFLMERDVNMCGVATCASYPRV